MNTVGSDTAKLDHGPQPNKLVFMVAMILLFAIGLSLAFPVRL